MNGAGEQHKPAGHHWWQYGASIVTVIGGVMTVLSGQLLWLLPVGAALAFFVYALRARRWALATTSLTAVVVVTLGTAIYMHKDAPPEIPSASQNQSSTAKSPEANSPARSSAVAGAKSTEPKRLFDGEVILKRHEAVDIDLAEPVVAGGKNSASGDFDLYLDPSGLPGTVRSHREKGVYSTSATSDYYDVCVAQFDPSTSGRNHNLWVYLYPGYSFCFESSDGRMTWGRVVEVDQPVRSQGAMAVTMHIVVWDK